jgi:[ribosomal protein S5]-alanine N-acetyltransferase
MQIIIETARLLIREFLPEDEHLYLRLRQDDEVVRYISNRSDAETKSRFEAGIAEYGDGTGLGNWGIFDPVTNDFIGVCGLKPSAFSPGCMELGYLLNQKYWGKGLASEMVKNIIPYSFTRTNATEITAVTKMLNIASQRVLEKNGFIRTGSKVGDGEELAFFRLKK